jgi:pimeloyl-ACP methyl ester carboxylesterase
MLRSWYVLLFRVPRLAEWALSARDFHLIRNLFRRQPRKPAFSEDETDAYVDSLSKPGALTAALNWYRANAAPDAVHLARSARVGAPTLVIWGERDPALGVELLNGLEHVAPLVRVHRIAPASHWVQNEVPDEVNRVLIEFLSAREVHPSAR